MGTQEPVLDLHDVAPPWVHNHSIGHAEGKQLFLSTIDQGELPKILQDINHAQNLHSGDSLCDGQYYVTCADETRDTKQLRKPTQGWPGPGPGRPIGAGRKLDVGTLATGISIALSTAVGPILRDICERRVGLKMSDEVGENIQDPELAFEGFLQWNGKLPNFAVQKKQMWDISNFFGYPAVLLKMSGVEEAIVVHSSACSLCTCINNASESGDKCTHVMDFNFAMDEICLAVSLSRDQLDSLLRSYYVKRFVKKDMILCGDRVNLLFCVMVEATGDTQIPTSFPVVLLKRAVKTGKWICLHSGCLAGGSVVSCSHVVRTCQNIPDGMKPKGKKKSWPKQITDRKLSIFEEDEKSSQNMNKSENSPANDSSRLLNNRTLSLVPSEEAFDLDLKLTSDMYTGKLPVLKMSVDCHCDVTQNNHEGVQSFTLDVMLECNKMAIPCKFEDQFCTVCGKTSREMSCIEGLIWVSRFTAYTEVSLFEALYQMVFGGTSMSSIAETRGEMLNLSPAVRQHRSEKSLTRALGIYSKLVHTPQWIFRCMNCCQTKSGFVYYRHLSFDGLVVGHRKSRLSKARGEALDQKQSFIERNPEAAAKAYLVEGRAMRAILFEALRARPAPETVNSLDFLRDKVFGLRIKTKEMAKAALHALQLLDREGWETARLRKGLHKKESVRTILENLLEVAIDCRRIARILSVALVGLNSELLKEVELEDREVLSIYYEAAEESLKGWITMLNAKEVNPQNNSNTSENVQSMDIELETPGENKSGISEHVRCLQSRGGRLSNRFQWIESGISENNESNLPVVPEHSLDRFQSFIRNSGSKRADYDNSVKILLLLQSCVKDPACVWMTEGSFDAFNAVTNDLLAVRSVADITRLKQTTERRPVQNLRLLCEGALAVAWSIEGGSSELVKSVGYVLKAIPAQHESFVREMYKNEMGGKQIGLLSPLQYDRRWFATEIQERFAEETKEPKPAGASVGVLSSSGKASTEECRWEGNVLAPDFPRLRPSPTDSQKGSAEKQEPGDQVHCVKFFPGDKTFTPGTFIVTCSCSHPKCIAVINLCKPEGSRVPVNFIIERCRQLPEVVVYDFGCGALTSALGISVPLVESTRFVIDRFHFSTHRTCSLSMHPDSIGTMKGKNTSSQEQRNSRIRPLQSSLREMTEENFKNLTALAHALHNGKAMFRDHLESRARMLSKDVTKQTGKWTVWLRDELKRRSENT